MTEDGGYRALVLEPLGGGRMRLRKAQPARFRGNRLEVMKTSDRWVPVSTERRQPVGLQLPDGRVRAFDCGEFFDSRFEFLKARGAV